MKRILTTTAQPLMALAIMAGTLAFGGAASAQSHNDHYGHDRGRDSYDRRDYRDDRRDDRRDYRDDRRDDRRDYRRESRYAGWHDHSDWRRGGYVAYSDWDRGYVIDYHRHHLRAPPRGYEWREVNGNYVLAAISTGLIVSLILGG